MVDAVDVVDVVDMRHGDGTNTTNTRPGKHTKKYGKSPCFMGKSTISTGPFDQFSIAILT